MSTNTPHVLPWHREAAEALMHPSLGCDEQDTHERVSARIAAVVARHDPHAKTVLLLKDIAAVIGQRTEGHTVVYSDRLRPLLQRIRVELAVLQQEETVK